MNKQQKYILWFKDINAKDVLLVGGKNASLGEMVRGITKKGINIPDGFATTSYAYRYFLTENNLLPKLKEIFKKLNVKDIKSLREVGRKARNLILKAEFSEDLQKEIIRAYHKLGKKYGKNPDVAVRSSATAEDLPTASFAGLHETYLNIKGEKELLEAVKKCIASLFNDRAISYREEKDFSHFKIALSVGVQKMVRSDLASAGVIFTLDTETGFKDVVLINSSWGLGEMVVKGRVIPDEFLVFKPTLKEGFEPIISRNLGTKRRKLFYSNKLGKTTQEIKVPLKDQNRFTLSDEEILKLANWAVLIEDHYSKKAKKWLPQDIEWAKDGKTNQLFIVQSRPETVHAPREIKSYTQYVLKERGQLILEGEAIGSKITSGKVKIIPNVAKIKEFKTGEILVTRMTDPDWTNIMKVAKGIITEEGGRTCFSGNTKILTNEGYLPIKRITEIFKKEDIKVLSLNSKTLQLEWKKVINGIKRKSRLIGINISQTGRMKDNVLKVTPDHKFLTFCNRKLISKEIQELLRNKEYILSCQQFPSIYDEKFGNLTPELSYFLGGISTDGHIHLSRTHGEVQFIQKRIPEKLKFIEKMTRCLKNLFNYSFHQTIGEISKGQIRGKPIRGSANRYRCYSKEIATYLKEKQNKLSKELLIASEEILYNFLAGVIDGDGTYNRKENKINIFCSNSGLLNAISIACLRLGISFQVSTNRTIYNIQIVDKVKEILQYTSRVKGEYERVKFGTRFFAAKQILEDVIDKVNYKGRIKLYIKNNLLLDIEKIRNYVIPLIKGQPENHSLTQIINSPLKMLRVSFRNSLGVKDVYNIEVEDNHNYVVFTNRRTPVVVLNCHAAIVSRELGTPCMVGVQNAIQILKTGQNVTLDCSGGQKGKIFEGQLKFVIKKYNLKKIPKTKTKIMMNTSHPDVAFLNSFLPNSGVGLAREEFIIASQIQIHPLALYHFEKLRDKKLKRKIEETTIGYKDKKEYFVDKLSQGIGRIAAAFWPKPVIVRFSDFKSNEYAQLLGGNLFEPEEANPMLGWRGASRYYDPQFQPAFLFECQALKIARERFGLKNIWAMIPFCRTVEEGKKVLGLMKKGGLERGKGGLKVIVMCEIPSNVILADKFLEIFDGMSIGSNDLTQLMLGLDRDSALVSKVGDERNTAVKEIIKRVIQECKKRKKYVGICGEAPSTWPEFAEFLTEQGIESMSLNPDTVIKTTLIVAKKEKQLKK